MSMKQINDNTKENIPDDSIKSMNILGGRKCKLLRNTHQSLISIQPAAIKNTADTKEK